MKRLSIAVIAAIVLASCASTKHLQPHYSYKRKKAGCLETKTQGFLQPEYTLYEGCDCRDIQKKGLKKH